MARQWCRVKSWKPQLSPSSSLVSATEICNPCLLLLFTDCSLLMNKHVQKLKSLFFFKTWALNLNSWFVTVCASAPARACASELVLQSMFLSLSRAFAWYTWDFCVFIRYCWEKKSKSCQSHPQPSLVNARVYQRASTQWTSISFCFLWRLFIKSFCFCSLSVLRNRHFINFIFPFLSSFTYDC